MKHEVRVICRKCDEAQIVYCHYKHMRDLTDEEILKIWRETPINEYNSTQQRVCDFAKAILEKAQEK